MTIDRSGAVHPEVNALADLAADVLPLEEARAVEAHVMACPDCAGVLADAERVRPLLRSDDVGRMPDDVWFRLSGALAQESAERFAVSGPPVPRSPVPAPESAPWEQHWQVTQASGPTRHESADTPWIGQANGWDRSPLDQADIAAAGLGHDGTVRDQHTAPAPPQSPAQGPAWGAPAEPGRGPEPDGEQTGSYTRMFRPLGDLNPSGLNSSAPGAERSAETSSTLPALAGSRVSGLRRPGRSGGPSRRDVRDSSRAENAVGSRLRKVDLGRRAPLLAAAAGVIVAVGLGGVVWSALGGGAETAESGQAAPITLPAVSAPVLASGRNYTEQDLSTSAEKLAKEASKAGANPASLDAMLKTSGPVALSESAVLSRCLDALSAGDQTPIAVDIARYQDREAAIIVLRAADGGYEVWAVSRDCGSGDEAPLKFVVVPKA